jgi:hypothetical protein
MQSNHHDIYRMVAEKTGKSEEMYKDIGSMIFKETAEMLQEPTCLILKLKGIGSWHLRKKRMEIFVGEFTEPTHDEYTSAQTLKEWEQKRQRYANFIERLKEYDKYLKIKQEVRRKRNETQVLLQPTEGKDESFKSG